MTLHKAKGLEFDTVILPGLAGTTPRGKVELLRWRRRPSGVLVGSLRARGDDEESPVYRYLTLLEREEDDAELGRLLYVGCTRAERRLHLIAALETQADEAGGLEWRSPPSGSALARLWPALQPPQPPVQVPETVPRRARLRLSRLPRGWRGPDPAPSVPLPVQRARTEPEIMPIFDWARETARSVGTVAHRAFRQIAQDGIERWPDARIAALRARFATELAHEGVAAGELAAAVERVRTALRRTLSDPRARWLFALDHREARSEYALTSIRDNALRSVVLDRTFVDETDTRWIVDFKFSQHEGANLDRFLDNERERYRAQLEEYAEVMRLLDARPIRLGLYFPLLAGWREWPAPV
jgi:ATP-dependent exoDNAse (exonuclease V) beta subunit